MELNTNIKNYKRAIAEVAELNDAVASLSNISAKRAIKRELINELFAAKKSLYEEIKRLDNQLEKAGYVKKNQRKS